MTFTISPEIIETIKLATAAGMIGFLAGTASYFIQEATRRFTNNSEFKINNELLISLIMLISFMIIGGNNIYSIAAATLTKTLIITLICLNESANYFSKENNY